MSRALAAGYRRRPAIPPAAGSDLAVQAANGADLRWSLRPDCRRPHRCVRAPAYRGRSRFRCRQGPTDTAPRTAGGPARNAGAPRSAGGQGRGRGRPVPAHAGRHETDREPCARAPVRHHLAERSTAGPRHPGSRSPSVAPEPKARGCPARPAGTASPRPHADAPRQAGSWAARALSCPDRSLCPPGCAPALHRTLFQACGRLTGPDCDKASAAPSRSWTASGWSRW